MNFDRETAEKLLLEHVQDEYQKLHSHMVANVLEEYAQKFGEDKDLWYITGLLHDLDYFEHPTEHPDIEVQWFTEWAFPQALIQAVQAHYFSKTKVDPSTKLDSALLATDELSGLLYAYSLMRPDKFIGMEPSSVKKKFKDKSFAAKVDRSDINYGLEKFQEDFYEHVSLMIKVFEKMKI